MTKNQKKSVHDMIVLISCLINHKKPHKNILDNLEVESLYCVAKKHYLTAMVAQELENLGIQSKQFSEAKAKAIRRQILFDAQRRQVTDALEENKIWYMPLKGCIIQDIYPGIGLRQMSDNDILFDPIRAKDVKIIMESLGFTTGSFGVGNHDMYFKEPVFTFEMHTGLFGIGSDPKCYEYYKNIKNRLISEENTSVGYHFSIEDFYVYMIAHENKHYNGCGTGLRSLLDTYIYLRHYDKKLDFVYIDAELEKLGLIDFEKQNRDLAFNLFDGKRLTDDNRKMFAYMVESGVYGTVDNQVAHRMQKLTGNGAVTALKKIKYYLLRTFPDSETLLPYYPPAKYKVLLPFVWLYRLVKALTIKRKAVLKEVSIIESLKRL